MKYVRRGVWFFAGRLFIFCLILALAITVFYYAMNLSNIQIILKDGMASRAKVVMGIESEAGTLGKYFQTACMNSDAMLIQAQGGNSPYKNYNVRGIDHRLDTGFLWTWPWDTTVRVTIHESIPRIDGRVKGTVANEVIREKGAGGIYPPAWQDADYRITMIKENGQWKIGVMVPINE